MAQQDITSFLSNFKGGARANRFNVVITPSNFGGLGNTIPPTFQFLCRASSIPSATVAPVDVPYMGAIVKVAGDRTFDDWMVSVYNDTDWAIRTAFERWINLIMTNQSNVAILPDTQIYADGVVSQLDRQGKTIPNAQYTLKNIFPTSVGAIELAYDNNNAIETFDVTFAVSWWSSASTS